MEPNSKCNRESKWGEKRAYGVVVSSIVLPAGNGRGGASEEEQRMKEKEGKKEGSNIGYFDLMRNGERERERVVFVS